MILMLIAGVGCLLAGLLAIGLGIPVKEFSFGNTLIVTGVVGACAGLIILGMSAVLRELKNIAGRPGSALPSNLAETATQPTSAAIAGEGSGFLLSRDQSGGRYDGAGADLQSKELLLIIGLLSEPVFGFSVVRRGSPRRSTSGSGG